MELPKGRWTTGSRRVALALSVGSIGISALASASLAQAHEPWVAKAWGKNESGQLGDGSSTGPEKCGPHMRACSVTPIEVSKLSGVVAVAGGGVTGSAHSIALLEGGTVAAWGEGFNGQLGDGTRESSDVPVAVKELSGVAAISAGGQFGLALLTSGKVMAWGQNAFGQLGDGTTTLSDVPVEVSGLKEVTAISAGGQHGLALLANGTVMAWGENGEGQLGNGTTKSSDVPVEVSGLKEVTAISAGGGHSLALLSDGKVVSWGANEAGQLGHGTEAKSDVPVAVCAVGVVGPCPTGPYLSGVTAVAAAGTGSNGGGLTSFSLALLKDGTVAAWGNNESGQLGDGSSTGPERCGELMELTCSKTPVAVGGLNGVAAIAARGRHSLALLSNATVLSWGFNEDGQLGDGTSVGPEPCAGIEPGPCSTKPTPANGLVDVKGIAAGEEHSLAFGPLPPSVSGISPNEPRKKGTTKVTITGADFEEATEVKFGSAKAASFTVNSQSSITALAPAGKGTVDVIVTTPAGTSATSAADRFNYSRPAVKKVSPRKGSGLGGTSVTITGTNFSGTTAVKFGSSEALSFKVTSDTAIVAVSPPHAAGKVNVTVSSPNGTSLVTGKDRFKYT